MESNLRINYGRAAASMAVWLPRGTVFSPSISATTVFTWAVLIGLFLRLIPVIIGDISPGGDGSERLGLAVAWAAHPSWQGLSGTWPHAHWYFLGTLIRIWNEPI